MTLKAFTANSKTILSVDFNRDKTCSQICSYCYVENMERIYPAYSNKINSNYEWALKDANSFASQLNTEYWKLRNSKAKNWKRLHKLPVRIYGSGDYIPTHYNFLSQLTFKFFIISKTLTLKTMKFQVDQLHAVKNLASIVYSFDKDNLKNYKYIHASYFGKDRCKLAFTGMPDDFKLLLEQGYKFDIFFNISGKQIELQKSRNFKEQCPCDSGVLAHAESCSHCNKCWRSSVSNII